MFRGKTARSVITLITAVLLALQFFAPTASFAPAHTARHAEAKAQPVLKLGGKALRTETITFRDCGASGTPPSRCACATVTAPPTAGRRRPSAPCSRRTRRPSAPR